MMKLLSRKLIIPACALILTACGSKKVITNDPTPTTPTTTTIPTPTQGNPAGSDLERREYKNRYWDKLDYNGEPWVKNTSKPIEITEGLQGRHLSVWSSHGRYYDAKKGKWVWQRPNLFGTTEDLFTQTVVVPYLIPMLENAGANVWTPRERDWQPNEVIVDNDNPYEGGIYAEGYRSQQWGTVQGSGFAFHKGTYRDGENPFAAGSARWAQTDKHGVSTVTWQPSIPKSGKYAVYVSYATVDGSIDDAHYTVYHKGEKTTFSVNQRMGGGTWVYLGTFDFDAGNSEFNRVSLSNESHINGGIVTADAVRFGGGMGNVTRGGSVSGLPRCIEAARYWAQWAGAPYSIYSYKKSSDDYSDDIRVRPAMTNWLAGGSVYVPQIGDGLKVPIELSMAVHSDAGYARDFQGIIGTLTISTTTVGESKTTFGNGKSRFASSYLARQVLDDLCDDMQKRYGRWNKRDMWDRNYGETRVPEMPSLILEMLSHQNFPDMRMIQDPTVRFYFARSLYRSLLRIVTGSHGQDFTMQPLPPKAPSIQLGHGGSATIRWAEQTDELDRKSKATSYILYTSINGGGFDNGKAVSGTRVRTELQPGVLYTFRISGVNKGGESFMSEPVSAVYRGDDCPSVLVVNGFHRVSAPAIKDNAYEQGFDFSDDPGVPDGLTCGWAGPQTGFSKSGLGSTSSSGLGYSSNEWAGRFFMGNDFSAIRTHAEAIREAGMYNVSSCSEDAVRLNAVSLRDYDCVDYILGLEKNDAAQMTQFKALPHWIQDPLRTFTKKGGHLLVSGSYVGSDMQTDQDRQFIADVLKVNWEGNQKYNPDATITGMGTEFSIFRQMNEDHYAAHAPDVLMPVRADRQDQFPVMLYTDDRSACVAYSGKDYRSLTMGFPFECITSADKRAAIMGGVLQFLLAK